MSIQTTTFQKNVAILGDLAVTGSLSGAGDSLTVPSSATAPSSPTVGDMYYDTVLVKFRVYQATGWTNVDGTSAGSLDASYNGGAEIAVDGGAVTLTDTQTTTGGGLLITKSGVVTGSNSASVFHINSTGAHDTSGTVKFFEISVGSETIGTPIGMEVAMNANGDSALTVTKGAVTLSDGALTLTDGAMTMTSGNFTMSSGNADITGTLAVSGTSTLAAIANSGAITSQGVVIIDVDNAEAFLIRENGDAANVLTVDTTQDAGDTSMLLTTKVTTGTGMHIDGSTITTGDALKVTVAAATMTAAGAAISVVADGTEVFAVRDDGAIYSKATAEGTTAFEMETGDLVITDGDFTLSGGEVTLTDGITTAGSGLKLTSSMTTAGNAAGGAGALTIVAASATTGTVLAITADALTSGDMLYLDNGGGTLNGGFYINCNDDNTSDFTVGADGATTITTAVATTAALSVTGVQTSQSMVVLDNASGVIAADKAVLSLDAGGAVASGGNVLRVAPTGTPNAGAIGIEFVGAGKALNAMYVDADPTASDVVTINGGGALTNDNAVLVVSSDGALATGGNTFRIETTGTPASGAIYAEYDFAGVTDTHENIGVKIDAGGKKVIGLHVDADPIANDVVYLHSDAVIADNKAVLNITSAGALASGSNVLRVDVTGTPASGAVFAEFDFAGVTDTHENVGVHIDATSKKVQALKINAAPLAGSSVLVTSTGLLAADKATMELVSNVAACNADSAVLRLEQTATDGVALCLIMKQDDVSQPFMNFEGTSSADAASSISSHGTSGATTDHVQIQLNGVKAWVAVSTSDPSA